MSTFRLRRSALYTPASNDRALEKARGLNADVLILDLEDAVAPTMKEAARSAAADAVRAQAFPGREVLVRINPPDTEDGVRDLDAVVPAAPDALVLPKVEHADEIAQMCAALDESGAARGLALWAMIETPLGVINVADIARTGARRRLAGLIVGANDLADRLRCQVDPMRTALTPLMMTIITAARAHGLAVWDAVYNNHADTEGFAAEARQARLLGFDGKTLIHPSQIDPLHAAFEPTPDDVVWARRIIAAYAEPGALARGAITLDGKMVERMHLDAARRTLALLGEETV